MRQGRIWKSSVGLAALLSAVVLFASGCSCSKKTEPLQRENQALSQRVAELEGQLSQMETAMAAQRQTAQVSQPVFTPAPAMQPQPVQPQPSQTVYVVAKGDTLWSIAKKQLGSGTRYTEILALNPQITKEQSLSVGTRLTIPAK